MIRMCSRCRGFIGEKEPLEDERVTHSICEKCLEKLKTECLCDHMTGCFPAHHHWKGCQKCSRGNDPTVCPYTDSGARTLCEDYICSLPLASTGRVK